MAYRSWEDAIVRRWQAEGKLRVAGRAVPATERSINSAVSADIGIDTTIEGRVSSRNDLRVQGEVKGPLDLPGHVLHIAETGRVEGRVKVGRAAIGGTFDGDIEASELVTVTPSERVRGSMTCRRVVLEDGAVVDAELIVG